MTEDEKARIDGLANKTNKFLNLVLCLVVGGVIGIVATKMKSAEAQGKPKKPVPLNGGKAPTNPWGGGKNPLTGQCDPTEDSNRLKISYLCEVERGAKVKIVMMSGVKHVGWVMNVKQDQDVVLLNVGTPEDPDIEFLKPTSIESCNPE